MENRSPADFAVYRNGPAVLCDRTVCGRQPQPRSLAGLLGCEKRFKNTPQIFRYNAAPRVANLNLQVGPDLKGKTGSLSIGFRNIHNAR